MKLLIDNHGQFAFYYEDDNGEYQKSSDTKQDSGNYILNISESTCDGEKNPKFLSWNKENITGKTIYEELTDTSGFGFLPIGDPK